MLLFFIQNDEGTFLQDIRRTQENKIGYYVHTNPTKVRFTHYTKHFCKTKEQQELLCMSILHKFQIKSHGCATNMEFWGNTKKTKTKFSITKTTLNKIQNIDRHSCIIYNGIIYWHFPSIQKIINEGGL